jgi:hypothetical protein
LEAGDEEAVLGGDGGTRFFASMETKYIIVQSDNGIIMVLFFFVLFV